MAKKPWQVMWKPVAGSPADGRPYCQSNYETKLAALGFALNKAMELPPGSKVEVRYQQPGVFGAVIEHDEGFKIRCHFWSKEKPEQ